MYLVGKKEEILVDEVLPHQPFKGLISVDTRQRIWMSDSAGKVWGYPIEMWPYLILLWLA
jgi:hypothetical protein